MSDFNELIKSAAKSRDYIRDFYVYGFKSRQDFDRKSSRTYDNERRRIESWLAPYIKWEQNGTVKNVFLAFDTNALRQNPLYRIFEAKSFTDNDIMLHFYLLDMLFDGRRLTADDLSNEIAERYGEDIDVQIVRKKANEYVSEGLFMSERCGKKLRYFLSRNPVLSKKTSDALKTALCFYQTASPIGFMGYSLMKSENLLNDIFVMKHGYFVHALEEEILLKLLEAIKEGRRVILKTESNKSEAKNLERSMDAVPLRIYVSTRSGRRFLCLYVPAKKYFFSVRLDHIKEVKIGEKITDYIKYRRLYEAGEGKCYGVSFGDAVHTDSIKLTLRIMEPEENYILKRLETEARGGKITRVGENTYTYEISVFDGNELTPWIKTFIGRIVSFESSNEYLTEKFKRDLKQMMKMYDVLEIDGKAGRFELGEASM